MLGTYKSPPQGVAETIQYNERENNILAKVHFFLVHQRIHARKKISKYDKQNMKWVLFRAQPFHG